MERTRYCPDDELETLLCLSYNLCHLDNERFSIPAKISVLSSRLTAEMNDDVDDDRCDPVIGTKSVKREYLHPDRSVLNLSIVLFIIVLLPIIIHLFFLHLFNLILLILSLISFINFILKLFFLLLIILLIFLLLYSLLPTLFLTLLFLYFLQLLPHLLFLSLLLFILLVLLFFLPAFSFSQSSLFSLSTVYCSSS